MHLRTFGSESALFDPKVFHVATAVSGTCRICLLNALVISLDTFLWRSRAQLTPANPVSDGHPRWDIDHEVREVRVDLFVYMPISCVFA